MHTTLVKLADLNIAPQIRMRKGFEEASLRELSASIQKHGLLQPIIVRPNDRTSEATLYPYTLIAGERRVLAATLAGFDHLPAYIRNDLEESPAAVVQAIENLQREDLCLMDRAEGVAAIVAEHGPKKAAALLSKSPAWISKHTSIAKLPQAIRFAAAEGDCEDAETLLTVRQLGKAAKTPAQLSIYNGALMKLSAGELSRQDARDTLARIQAAAAPTTTEPDTGEEGTEGEGEQDGQEGTAPTVAWPAIAEAARKLAALAEQLAQAAEAGNRAGIDAAIGAIRKAGRSVTDGVAALDQAS